MTSLRTLGALAALVAVLGPRSVRAQSAAADARLGRLDAGTRAAIVAIVDSARANGLPAEPLVDKALEGASKGAPGPRIVVAVRALSLKLGAARQALGAAPGDALVAGADALRAGASHVALAELRALRPADQLGVPLAVLADLVARGVPPDTAAAIVLTLARSHASDDEYVALRRAVERDVQGGIPPATSIAARANAVIVAGPPRPAAGAGASSGPATAEGLRPGKP